MTIDDADLINYIIDTTAAGSGSITARIAGMEVEAIAAGQPTMQRRRFGRFTSINRPVSIRGV